jgi:hypothetical protein
MAGGETTGARRACSEQQPLGRRFSDTGRQRGRRGDKGAGSTRPVRFCDSRDVLPVVYRLSGRELEEAAEPGELVLGESMFSFGAPDQTCKDCGGEWQSGVLLSWFRSRFAAG